MNYKCEYGVNMVFCPECGKEVKDAKFCSNCGSLLPKVDEPVEAPAVEEPVEEVVPEVEAVDEPVEEVVPEVEADEAVDVPSEEESVEEVVQDVEADDPVDVPVEEESVEDVAQDEAEEEVTEVTAEEEQEEVISEDSADELAEEEVIDTPAEEEAAEDTVDVNVSKNTKFCSNCGTEVAIETVFCPQCGFRLIGEDKPQTKFCQNCGKKIDINAEICPHCGVRVANVAAYQEKNSLLAAILSFLFPGLGHIYLGLNKKGISFIIAYIVSAILILLFVGIVLCIIVWLWALIDSIKSTEALNRGEFVEDKLF